MELQVQGRVSAGGSGERLGLSIGGEVLHTWISISSTAQLKQETTGEDTRRFSFLSICDLVRLPIGLQGTNEREKPKSRPVAAPLRTERFPPRASGTPGGTGTSERRGRRKLHQSQHGDQKIKTEEKRRGKKIGTLDGIPALPWTRWWDRGGGADTFHDAQTSWRNLPPPGSEQPYVSWRDTFGLTHMRQR